MRRWLRARYERVGVLESASAELEKQQMHCKRTRQYADGKRLRIVLNQGVLESASAELE